MIAQRPKLAGYIPQMKKNIADVLGLSEEQVNVKATTEEGLGFTGEGLGIAASAVCLLSGCGWERRGKGMERNFRRQVETERNGFRPDEEVK